MIHLLTGTNAYAIKQATNELIAANPAATLEHVNADELRPADIPQLVSGASLFSDTRLVIIEDLSRNKSIWSALDELLAAVPDETTLVLIEQNPDKRTKAYKWLQKNANVRELNELDEPKAAQWVQSEIASRGGEIEREYALYLVRYVGLDQWRLSGELDKLLLAEAPITKELIQDITEPHPQATAFELLDAAFGGDQATLERLLGIVSRSEDPYKFFGLLASQVFALAAVSTADTRRSDEVAKDLGLHPFVVRKLSSLASRLNRAQINTIVAALADTDERLKTTGAEPWSVISRLLLSIRPT
jgi:DNA polymerase-3 subunit delta